MVEIPYVSKSWARKRAKKSFDEDLKGREIAVAGLGKVKPVRVAGYNSAGWIFSIYAKKGNKQYEVDVGNITAIGKKLKKVL